MEAGVLSQFVAARSDLREPVDRFRIVAVDVIAVTSQVKFLAPHLTAQFGVIVHIGQRLRIVAQVEMAR